MGDTVIPVLALRNETDHISGLGEMCRSGMAERGRFECPYVSLESSNNIYSVSREYPENSPYRVLGSSGRVKHPSQNPITVIIRLVPIPA